MLLPELAADAGPGERIKQLADYALEAEAIIQDQGRRLDVVKGALICEERWRKRLWDENKALRVALNDLLNYNTPEDQWHAEQRAREVLKRKEGTDATT